MPTRETAPIGAPCWVDLTTSDTDRSREFYGRLFGWEAEEPAPEFGGYFNFTRNGVRVAGCMAAEPSAQMADVWSVYLTTDDARKTVDAASGNGGQVVVGAMDVGDLGTMAVVTDPAGAAIGIWQPGLHQGFGDAGRSPPPTRQCRRGTPRADVLDHRNFGFGAAAARWCARDSVRPDCCARSLSGRALGRPWGSALGCRPRSARPSTGRPGRGSRTPTA